MPTTATATATTAAHKKVRMSEHNDLVSLIRHTFKELLIQSAAIILQEQCDVYYLIFGHLQQ